MTTKQENGRSGIILFPDFVANCSRRGPIIVEFTDFDESGEPLSPAECRTGCQKGYCHPDIIQLPSLSQGVSAIVAPAISRGIEYPYPMLTENVPNPTKPVVRS